MKVLFGYAALLTAILIRRFIMARGDPYAPEEDAIILSTHRTTDILAALGAAGFQPRTSNAVKQRRNELRKKGLLGRTGYSAPASSPIISAATDYETAKAHLARLRAELGDAERKVQSTRKQLGIAMARED